MEVLLHIVLFFGTIFLGLLVVFLLLIATLIKVMWGGRDVPADDLDPLGPDRLRLYDPEPTWRRPPPIYP
jgi:hypothetical protein